MEIKQCTVAEVFDHPDTPLLFEEYAAEASLHGLPLPRPVRAIYERLQQAGALFVLVAFDGERMAGFMGLLISLNPHYGAKLGVSESFFVRPVYRKSGAGFELLHLAERITRESDAEGLLVSAPYGGRLEAVLGLHDAYQQSNSVFFRSFAHVARAA